MDKEVVLDHIKKDEKVHLEQLIHKGLELHCRFRSGRTMLHEAASYNAPKTTGLLLNRGIDPNVADDHGICPLHLVASYEDRLEIADLLFLVGESLLLDPKDKYGQTPLHFAVALNNYPMIERLMKKGAEPALCDEDGQDAFDKANGGSTILGILYSKKDEK